MTSNDMGQLTIERTYSAPLDKVWGLWTTKDGFESWWGPQGFRVQVGELDAREGGALRYEMMAATPEMIAEMERMGQPPSHSVQARYAGFKPRQHLVITSVIDFLPDVAAYENRIAVDFSAEGPHVRMVVKLEPMHDPEMSRMQQQGFTSQLTKVDARFATSDG